ncbi:MAG: hypothetical protein HYZ36_03770, partial [Pedosphaera parvula]|nr:hypothetical protein [Pedosphaera parvula]
MATIAARDFLTANTGSSRAVIVALLIASIAGSSGCAAAGAIASAPPPGVVESLEQLPDDSRARDVPIMIYAPSTGDRPFPVILFSHGLGSSRQGYAYLGWEWASRGYVSIHVQHVGSDSELLRTKGLWAIYRAPFNGQEYEDRPLDISFVIDTMERRAASAKAGSLWARLDLSRIGVGGHSYGAHTALTLVGMLVNFPHYHGRSFRDARVKAALILSPPAMAWSPTTKEFAPIHSPTMHMSGSRDTSQLWHITLSHRRRAFDCIRGAPRYFLNIDDATHPTFADHETMRVAKKNGRLDRTDPPWMRVRTAEEQRQIAL